MTKGDRTGRVLARLFPLFERLGVHVTRTHFYEPIPDTRTLAGHPWDSPSDAVGIDLREEEQLELLQRLVSVCGAELSALPRQASDEQGYYLDNPQFGGVDAHVLYGLVRYLKPAKVIEVGSGFSTLLAARALERNREDDPTRSGELTAIEPYPPAMITGPVPGLTRLIDKAVQDVPLGLFEELGQGDILFVDSSHVLKIGSDVVYELLEVIPRLKPGVWVHVHDVYLPWEYPRHLVVDWRRFWNEQYALHAFLAFNGAFEVRWTSYLMTRTNRKVVESAFGPIYPRASGLPPSSVWLERVG